MLTPRAVNQMPTTGQDQEEVKAAAVVEGSVLEDQATEVTVGSHDVVGLFLLAELSRSSGTRSRWFHAPGRRSPGSRAWRRTGIHRRHLRRPSCGRVHQDVVLGLEHQHEVEGARDAQGMPSEKEPDRRGTPGRLRKQQRQGRCKQHRSGRMPEHWESSHSQPM